jgi:hypothetical protein
VGNDLLYYTILYYILDFSLVSGYTTIVCKVEGLDVWKKITLMTDILVIFFYAFISRPLGGFLEVPKYVTFINIM